jgi:hypothetical protein
LWVTENLKKTQTGLGWKIWVQLITMQNDLQKQVSVMVAVPVSKEGKRIEGEKRTSYSSSSSSSS